MANRPQVTIYTDGGASPNPGPGGWGVVLIHATSGKSKELYGGEPDTTNNRMELTAAIKALQALKEPCQVSMVTDSEYLRRGVTEWLPKWIKNKWKRKKNEEIQNEELWRMLADLNTVHEISWQWTKGHAGDRYNERADQLASQAIREHRARQAPAQTADAEVYLGVSVRNGNGIWAALVRAEGDEEIVTGEEENVTSNSLDIAALAEVLGMLPERVRVNVYTYSDYLRNGATQWLKSWRARNWRTKEGDEVKNKELWQWLEDELRQRKVEFPSLKDLEIPPSEFEQLEDAIKQIEQGGEGSFRWE